MTLQKEFYANFIVQRLTLKVINMDTLYLVFKDRYQPSVPSYRIRFCFYQTTLSRLKQKGILPTWYPLVNSGERNSFRSTI